MKRLCCLLILTAVPAFGQVEQGKIEGELHRFEFAFNPYSYAQLGSQNLHGVSANLGIHFFDNFALVVDFSLNRSMARDILIGDSHEEVFAGRIGPRFTARSGRTSLYGQILAGGMHLREISNVEVLGTTQRVTSTVHGWAGLAGGGIDVGLKDWWTFRAFQAEYNVIEYGGGFLHGVRLGAGFVFHLH